MNFIVELPVSPGFNTVIKVVNSMSKRIYFIPTYITVTIENSARCFLYCIQKLHGLSICIVLDRELQFIIYFTKKLYYMVGSRLLCQQHSILVQ